MTDWLRALGCVFVGHRVIAWDGSCERCGYTAYVEHSDGCGGVFPFDRCSDRRPCDLHLIVGR